MTDNIEYWIQKCSICFDAHLDFCVERCRDQFCFGCFDKYVNELLNHAWGMSNFEVKCPVCSESMSESEWTQYVRPETSRRFRQLNRPFPVFTRFCNACDTAIPAVETPDPQHQITESDFVGIITMMERSGFFTPSQIEQFQDESFKFMQNKSSSPSINSLYRLFLYMYRESLEQISEAMASSSSPSTSNSSSSSTTATSGPAFFTRSQASSNELFAVSTIVGKRKRSRGPSFTARLSAASISSKLIALENRGDSWKELQFLHISNFSQGKCSHCDRAICFRCGEATWHRGMSCEIYLARKVENKKGSTDSLANLKWKLSNSKACPNCCIFIARDEGCNKVDCVNCGHRFCWICLKPWSEDCGFFRCANEKNGSGGVNVAKSFSSTSNINNATLKMANSAAAMEQDKSMIPRQLEKTENGVPNVHKLFSQINEKHQQQNNEASSLASSSSSSSPPIAPALPPSLI